MSEYPTYNEKSEEEPPLEEESPLNPEPVPFESIFTRVGRLRGVPMSTRLIEKYGEENIGWKIVETDIAGYVNVIVLPAGNEYERAQFDDGVRRLLDEEGDS